MSELVGIQRIDATFQALREQGRKALVIYLMAGDPDPAFTQRLVPQLYEAGADLVELGFPFSDPVADGPVIQEAAQRALPQFSGLPAFLDMVRGMRKDCSGPLVCMTYYNPIFKYGEKQFFQDALAAGLDGLIIPDLPLVEATDWRTEAEAAGIAPIFLEAPNSSDADAEAIGKASRGFIYMLSLKGVTGSDTGLGENLKERIERLRKLTKTPLAIGFGISTPDHAEQFGILGDGVVVGSGFVSKIANAKNPDSAIESALAYVRELRAGVDRAKE